MHRYTRQMLFAAVAALGVIGSAKASTVGTEPIGLATNDIVGPQTGYFGANLYASGALTIEYTYLGKEAGFDNAFLVLGNTKFDTNTTSPGSTAFETLAAAGQLNFSFYTNLPAGASVANGSNTDIKADLSYTGPNFFVSFYDPTGQTTNLGAYGYGYSGIIALDDGGAGPDKDFDDLVVKFQIMSPGTLMTSAVPEPSTWAMMILGFFGVGFMAYRRKQNWPQLRLA